MIYPDSFLIQTQYVKEIQYRIRRNGSNGLLHVSCCSPAQPKRIMREGSGRSSLWCFRLISKTCVCQLHPYVCEQHRKKTEIGFSANVELFDLL